MATVVREPRSNYFALWFGFLGAPAAWSIQELATLAITSHVCYPMNEPLHAPVVSGMWWTDLAIVIGSLLVGLAALAVAIAEWRKHRPAGDVDWRGEFAEASGGRAARYLAFSGILFGIMFNAINFYSGVAIFLVPLCGFH